VSLPLLAEAFRRLEALDGVVVSAGIQASEGRLQTEAAGTTLADVATWNHFGTEDIPARPWLEVAQDRNRRKWAALSGKVVEPWRKGQGLAELQVLSAVMVGDCQESLLDEPWAPNAPATIKRKGSDQPLVDTGRLVQSHRGAVELPDGTVIAINGVRG
jgi:hypothetical protein